MQEIRHDGSRGKIAPFGEDEMKEMLKNPEVKEVRVFKTKKTLDDQQPIAPEQKEQQPKVPKVIPEFRLRAGMKINLHGTLYKVTAARSNGKVTMKFIKFLDQ